MWNIVITKAPIISHLRENRILEGWKIGFIKIEDIFLLHLTYQNVGGAISGAYLLIWQKLGVLHHSTPSFLDPENDTPFMNLKF